MTTLMAAVLAGVPAVAAGLGFLLGAAWQRPKLRRVRAELAAALWAAEHDAVTGLPNRAGLQRHHQRLIAQGQEPAAVLLDLDDFKAVNDTWGHQAGDAVLTTVADRLAEGCAPFDAVAGRLAGDEFLLLLPRVTQDDALEVVQDLLSELGKPMTVPAGEQGTAVVLPTASAGIAVSGPGSERASAWSDLIRRADVALYNAKVDRGHTVLHIPGMRQPERHTDVGGRASPERILRQGSPWQCRITTRTQVRGTAWPRPPGPLETIVNFAGAGGGSHWSRAAAAGMGLP